MPLVDMPGFSRLYQALVVEQAGFSSTWSETSENRFSRDVAQMMVWLFKSCILGNGTEHS